MSVNEEAAQAWKVALRYLGTRPRSCGEMINTLTRHGFSQEARDATIRKLEELGYLNDAHFVEAWLHHRSGVQPRGSLWVKRELQAKKVPADLVEKLAGPYLAEHEEEIAWAVTEKKWPRWANDPRKRDKLARFLHGRGFSSATIVRVLDRLHA
jgi:regulatory protein